MSYEIDDLDRQIIDLLFEDARLSNRKIAQRLDFTEGTIRARVKRLEEDNIIRFTAVTNMAHFGRDQLAYIGILAEQDKIRSVAEAVKDLDGINAVIVLLGRFDILAIGLFKDLQDVHNVASNQILAIQGVRNVETTIAVDVVKYDSRLAKIIPPDTGA